jgi:hypothetical protein
MSGVFSEGSSQAADEVRKAFSRLPFEQKISTLIKVELDMVGDAVDTAVSAVSSAIDEVVKACDFSKEQASPTSGTGAQAPTS